MLDGDVEGLRAGVEGRVLKADIANGRGVDKRHEVLDIVNQEAEEKVDVLVFEAG